MSKYFRRILNPIVRFFYRMYAWTYYRYGKEHPMWLANKLYKKKFGRSINWEHPIEMNEKIRWMQFFTDTTSWSRLADKYQVRKYIQEKGYGNILIPLLGVWTEAKDIDFSKLPNSFVIKTNHGSGDVFIVKDKKDIDLEELRSKLKYYLEKPFGYASVELHYLNIRPCIIAEEMLPIDTVFSSSMVDYKFYCINGKPYCCAVFYDRDPITHLTNSTFYDMKWNRHDEWRSPHVTTPSKDIPKPFTLEYMIQACYDLASDFIFVRLDFYEVNKQLYFGEFTFTPAGLTGGSASRKLCEEIGCLMILPS